MTESKWNLYSIMRNIIGDDSGMIFGPTGSGKSMFVRSIIQSAVEQGVEVAMCDTEANYVQEDIDWLKANTSYAHATRLKGITSWAEKLPKKFRLLVVDSLGGPAYGEYVKADMKRAGDIFKNIAEAAYEIQQYCQTNSAMAILVNQPTSEFGGKDSRDPEPFGGKSGFYTKEVLKTVKLSPEKGWTIIRLDMYKSRHMRSGMVVANIAISDKTVAVKFSAYMGRRPNGWPETKCVIPNPAMQQPEEVEEEGKPEPEDSPDMEIEEEEEKGEDDRQGFEDELKSCLAEIAEIMAEKEIGEVQFKAIMKSKGIEIEFAEQISDLDTALSVREILDDFGEQKGNGSDKLF